MDFTVWDPIFILAGIVVAELIWPYAIIGINQVAKRLV